MPKYTPSIVWLQFIYTKLGGMYLFAVTLDFLNSRCGATKTTEAILLGRWETVTHETVVTQLPGPSDMTLMSYDVTSSSNFAGPLS